MKDFNNLKKWCTWLVFIDIQSKTFDPFDVHMSQNRYLVVKQY